MNSANLKLFKQYFRMRITHPLIVVLLMFCFSGASANAISCRTNCALNAELSRTEVDSIFLEKSEDTNISFENFSLQLLDDDSTQHSTGAESMVSESCCESGETMACCSSPQKENDFLSETNSELQLKNFELVIPSITSEKNSCGNISRSAAIATIERAKPRLSPASKIYIVNRSLLI